MPSATPEPSPDRSPLAATVFALRGDHITLDALLKATGLASSGGVAKMAITAGGVHVNGEPETRRGRKLRAGDEVVIGITHIRIAPSPAA